MKKRCYNPSFPQYKDYGGRGIKVCDEWMNTERVHTSCGRLHKGWDLDRVFAKIGEGNDKRDSN